MKHTILLLSLIFNFSLLADAPGANNEVKDKKIGSVLFLLNPAKVKVKTDYIPERLVDLVEEYRNRALDGEFLSIGINTGYIEMDVKGEKAKLTFFTSTFGKLEKAMKMKISPDGEGEEKFLKVKARIPYCQMKELYKARDEYSFDGGRWRFSKDVEKELERVIDL